MKKKIIIGSIIIIIIIFISIIFSGNKLTLGNPVRKKIIRSLESETDIEQLKKDDIITIHWDVPCEVISEQQVKRLKYYTLKSLELANQYM